MWNAYRRGAGFFLGLLLALDIAPIAAAERNCAPEPQAEEPASLAQSAGKAVRRDSILRLESARGVVELHDTDCENGPAGKCRQYRLASVLLEYGFYLVKVGFYEGGEYRLIDMKSGKATRLLGFPYFSPDMSRFVTATGGDPYDVNAIEVWRLSAKGPVREAKLTFPYRPPGEITYCFERWLDPQHVALFGTRWFGEAVGELQDALENFDATLVGTGGSWRVKRRN